MWVCVSGQPRFFSLVRLLPAPDLALARLAVSAAASAASAPPPQGHSIIYVDSWRYLRDAGDEALFTQCRVMDHQPATEALRIRMRRKVGIQTPRENAFRNLAMREVRSQQWRCGITIHDQYRQWEMVQVFRVEFDTEEGPDPAVEPNNCTLCGGQWLPLRTACPYHQFAISETQLHELWKKWDPRMDPINPIEQEYCDLRELFGPSQMIFPSDGWLIPGSPAYFDFFDAASQCVSAGLGFVCGVQAHSLPYL